MPSRSRLPPRPLRALARAVAAALALLALALPAGAQMLIRDAEIEATLKRLATPLFRSAGIGASTIDVLVIDDASLNAFVINGRAIFVHSGLIARMESPAMLQSVLSHELAHIAAGHLVRRGLNAQNANTAIGIGMLLALAVSVGGNGAAAGGIAAGTAGAAVSTFLANTRSEETIADQLGLRYLVRARIDPKAALEVLDLFRGQEALSPGRQDPYLRTHPLSRERIRALKAQIAAYAGRPTETPDETAYWFARMQAKFRGFLGNPSYVLRKLDKGDRSEAATLTRAIAYHRQGKLKPALDSMAALLAARPDDAYYHELRGQILLEGRQAAAAVQSYRRAVALAPKEPLILAGLGRAQLALNSRSGNRQALATLRRAYGMDPRDARMLRDLSVAWARAGNNGMAALTAAERYALMGRFKDAETNAKRAEGLLARGSFGWLRAQDILAAAKQLKH